MKYDTKRNIRIRVIALVCAFVLWGSGAYFLWNEKSRFPVYFVLVLIILSAVKDYIGWRKSRSFRKGN